MTGNIVFLGFAAAGAGGLSVVGSLLALACFFPGGIAASRLTKWLGDDRLHQLRAASAVELALCAAAIAVAAVTGDAVRRRLRGENHSTRARRRRDAVGRDRRRRPPAQGRAHRTADPRCGNPRGRLPPRRSATRRDLTRGVKARRDAPQSMQPRRACAPPTARGARRTPRPAAQPVRPRGSP